MVITRGALFALAVAGFLYTNEASAIWFAVANNSSCDVTFVGVDVPAHSWRAIAPFNPTHFGRYVMNGSLSGSCALNDVSFNVQADDIMFPSYNGTVVASFLAGGTSCDSLESCSLSDSSQGIGLVDNFAGVMTICISNKNATEQFGSVCAANTPESYYPGVRVCDVYDNCPYMNMYVQTITTIINWL